MFQPRTYFCEWLQMKRDVFEAAGTAIGYRTAFPSVYGSVNAANASRSGRQMRPFMHCLGTLRATAAATDSF